MHGSKAVDYTFSYPDYAAFRDTLHSFSGVIASNHEQMKLTAAGAIVSERTSQGESALGRLGLLPPGATNAEFTSVLVVSGNYFQVLGVPPLRGRSFESQSAVGLVDSPSVLISENFWRSRFAGAPDILGKAIQLNGAALKIAGITPHDFAGTFAGVPDFWLPISLEPLIHADPAWLENREHRMYRVFGRLAPGTSSAQAAGEMTLAAGRLRALHDPNSDWAKPAAALVFPGSPFPVPLRMNPPLMLTVLFIAAATAMVLLVACADVGSLQLVRARSRRHEFDTRLALGASRTRILRQLLTESGLLGIMAGSVAFPFTWGLLKLGVSWAAGAFPAEFGTFIFDMTPNLAVFGFAVGVSLLAGLLFGLAPALESSRAILTSSRATTFPAGSRRLQDLLVTAQVALTLTLLIAGSLLIRSSFHSLQSKTGYDTKHVFSTQLLFPEGAKYGAARRLTLVRDLRTRLAGLPGVTEVTSARPPGDYGFLTPAAGAQNAAAMHYKYVQPNYFETLGVPLLLGRGFPVQAGQSGRSLILSESAARQLWPGENPIGRNIRLGATDEQLHNPAELRADSPDYQVIGIVGDTRGLEMNGSDSRLVYLALSEDKLGDYPLLIRTRSDPAPAMRVIDTVVSSVDPNLVETSSMLEQMLRQSPAFIISSLAAAVASAVGALGLVLALMGIYGTVGYIVSLRTREIGIRMAVGAQKRDILALILGESSRPVLAGLLAGTLLALGVSYLLRGLLFGLGTLDAVSFIGVSVLFLAAALLAAYPPSRRAMRVDPVVALRHE